MGFIWNVEDYVLKNDKERQGKSFEIFTVENQINRDDKIAFIDSQTHKQMSDLLILYDQFQKEKDHIRKEANGEYKFNSLKNWYTKNASRYLDWSEYDLQFYSPFDRTIYDLMHRGPYDKYDDIVDEAFHKILCNLYRKEEAYYTTHNEYDVLKNKLINSNIFPLIGFEYWYGTDGIGKEVNGRHVKFTLEELRYLNNACDKLEGKIKNTSAKIRADFESIFPN